MVDIDGLDNEVAARISARKLGVASAKLAPRRKQEAYNALKELLRYSGMTPENQARCLTGFAKSSGLQPL